MIDSYNNTKEHGSILLYALLVMSAAVATGLTIGTIVINEIRQSRNLDEAIIAYYASESGIERASYAYRKDAALWATLYTDVGEGVVSDCAFDNMSEGQTCQTYYQDAQTWTFTLTPGEVKELVLFDGNLAGGGYLADSIVTTWQDARLGNLAEPILEMDVIELQGDWGTPDIKTYVRKCSTENGSYQLGDPVINTDSSCGTWTEESEIYSTEYYVVRYRALVDNVIVTVQVLDSSSGNLDIGKTEVFSTGVYKDAQQALRAELTSASTTSDFADFAIFSECDLTKGFGVEGTAACP